MRRRQEGVTAIGFLLLAAFAGLFAWAFLQLLPIYLEQMKVTAVLQDIKGELDGQKATPIEIRASIGKRLNIESINVVHQREFKIVKSENGHKVTAQFEQRAPYVANLYLVVVFDKTVEVMR
jgi:hypothetical protein